MRRHYCRFCYGVWSGLYYLAGFTLFTYESAVSLLSESCPCGMDTTYPLESSMMNPPPSSTPSSSPASSATRGRDWLNGIIFDEHYLAGPLIAGGGMAEVYYATDTWLNDSPVAIKILKPELAASPENQRKFYSEESSLRQMGGGHVIGVLSSGEPANIVLVDPKATRVIKPEEQATKGKNNPYRGMEVPGAVRATFYAGHPTVLNGTLSWSTCTGVL